MTDLTIRELDSISSHLKKVAAIQRQNDDGNEEITLDLPERITLNRVSNGQPLGHLQYSENIEEYVFMPLDDKAAPLWSVPIPPSFN